MFFKVFNNLKDKLILKLLFDINNYFLSLIFIFILVKILIILFYYNFLLYFYLFQRFNNIILL